MENKYFKTFSGKDLDSLISSLGDDKKYILLVFYGAEADHSRLYSSLKKSGHYFLGCMDAGQFLDKEYKHNKNSFIIMRLSPEIFEDFSFGVVNMAPGKDRESITEESGKALKKAARESGINLDSPDMDRDFAINILYGLNSANAFLEGQSMAGMLLQTVGGSSGGELDFKNSGVISHLGEGEIGAFGLFRLKKEFGYLIDRVSSFSQVKGKELKVTALGDNPRHITGLNGKAPVEAYSEALGITPGELSVDTFAQYTLGIDPGDEELLITSIMAVDEDKKGFLTYNDVIDGTVFNLYKAEEQCIMRSGVLDKIAGMKPLAFISFDCILCYLARQSMGTTMKVGTLYEEKLPGVPKIGFATFSENVCGANINQTETFIAFYKKGGEA